MGQRLLPWISNYSWQERATLVSLETVRARRFAGRRTNIYGFKPTTGFFYAGKFVKESQPGRNLIYWASWAGYKF
jgi:hypothetical protein